jgi:GNAT superfamily N-acetyltransferase
MNVEVNFAAEADAGEVRYAVESLLRELSGNPTRTLEDFAATFLALSSRDTGGVLVARDADTRALLGVLTYSLQIALRTGGNHCVIQELWVSDTARGGGAGSRLMDFLRREAVPDVAQIEVGLPGDGFAHLPSTRAFYEGCGFELIGARARWRQP